MRNSSIATDRSNLHPADLISQANLRLHALQQLIYYVNPKAEIDVLNDSTVKEGLFFLFSDISIDLKFAQQKLEGCKA